MADTATGAQPPAPPASRRPRVELEFLPAALEIVETPASPAARAIGGCIIGFFCLSLAWAWFGHVDIVATAAGRIIPSGRTKVVQPLEIGIVRAIHVTEGERVAAGQLLIELDPTESAAERTRLQTEATMAGLEVARLKAALTGESAGSGAFTPPDGTPARLVELHRQLLASQVAEQAARLASLDRETARRRADRAAVAATVAKISAMLPLVRERAEARRYLAEREMASRISHLELQQELIDLEQELVVQRSRLAEAEAALAGLADTRRQAEAEFRRDRLAELAQAEARHAALQQELVKAEQRFGLQRLTAPVAGVVQQLAVHTVGGVVTPAQPLLVVVPADSRLEVEATVANRDVGFVAAGQPAEIKVETFNFTRYGLLHGRVLHVSHDAVQQTGDRAVGGTGELVYTARVSLDRTTMPVDGQEVPLAPGMAVTVEIRTGERRVIEYLLSPVLRYRQEAFRER